MDELDVVETSIITSGGLTEMLIRFGINLLFAFVVIRLIYYQDNKNREYLFTFFVFNVVIFFVCFLLSGVKIKIGFAFGLFAVFSILRYRTEQMPIQEMTFLFLSITVAVINALVADIDLVQILITNLIICIITFFAHRLWLHHHYAHKMITYEKIELIKPDRKTELIADLEDRTGLKIHSFEVTNINFLRDVAILKVYFYELGTNTEKVIK